MKFSRITQRNKIANKLEKWFRLGEVKKDLKVSVYFKLDRAVFQKNKNIIHRTIHGARKLRKVPLQIQLQLKAGAAVRWDQIAQGLILSGLENLKERDSTDSVNNPSPCLPVHLETNFLMAFRIPLSFLAPKATSSPASPGCADSSWRTTASAPDHLGSHLLDFLPLYKKLQVFNKSRCCSPDVLKALGRACLTSRNNCKCSLKKKKIFRDEEWNLKFVFLLEKQKLEISFLIRRVTCFALVYFFCFLWKYFPWKFSDKNWAPWIGSLAGKKWVTGVSSFSLTISLLLMLPASSVPQPQPCREDTNFWTDTNEDYETIGIYLSAKKYPQTTKALFQKSTPNSKYSFSPADLKCKC